MNKFINYIKEKNPNINIEKYSLNSEGQNNDIIIINEEYVFKFPKYEAGIEKLKREVKILDVLNRYITLDIPEPKYYNFNSCEVQKVYCGYKIIKGVSFRKDRFNNVQEKNSIAMQLATFLKELHSIPYEEFQSFGVSVIDSHSQWEDLFNKVREKLFPFMNIESRRVISDNFNGFLNQKFSINKALIHGDFGPSNIIFNLDNQRISGVIDFNDVSIGDPAIDIASLIGPFGYGENFVKSFKSVYPNVEELLQRAKFYASTFALQEALFGLEVGDKEAFNDGMKEYIK